MPPRTSSRHLFAVGLLDDDGRSFLTDRVPFRFTPYDDNILHVVREGDTLFNLAGRYYAEMERPAGLWWAIADFQPAPIHDPTLKLTTNSVVIVPSVRTIVEAVMSEKRRLESVL
jgi:hypothetical protein